MTLTLSEKASARLTEAATLYGMDAEELLLTLLEEQESTVPENEEDAHAGIAEGLAELDAGKGRSFEEYVAEQRARWAARGQ